MDAPSLFESRDYFGTGQSSGEWILANRKRFLCVIYVCRPMGLCTNHYDKGTIFSGNKFAWLNKLFGLERCANLAAAGWKVKCYRILNNTEKLLRALRRSNA